MTFKREHSHLPERLPHFAYYEHDLNLEYCIYQIRYMPDHVIKLKERELQIILDFSLDEPDGELIDIAREEWEFQADWLEYKDLDNHKILPELTHTEIQYYEPIAEMSIATRQLAQQIIDYSSWMKDTQRPLSSHHWWLAVEQQLCEQALTKHGLFGKAEPIGGIDNYKRTVATKQNLMLSAATSKLNHGNSAEDIPFREAGIEELTPIQALESLAYLIAANDSEFRDSHYQNYLDKINSCNRRLAKDTPLSPVNLIGNTLKRMGRGVGTGTRKTKKK